MSQELDWQRIETILLEAGELLAAGEQSEGELAAFLDRACDGDPEMRATLERLLEADGASATELETVIASGAAAAFEHLVADAPIPVERIGPYKLVRLLGEGGSGSVYLARRDDRQFDHQVAIKILRHGPWNRHMARRFRGERQILAGLDHPNIARLFDGGTTADGSPYFVMELVEGKPIDRYCDRHRLDIDARLALFQDVCSAVHYAHRHLVVHRDLKPSNVLVTRDGLFSGLDTGPFCRQSALTPTWRTSWR